MSKIAKYQQKELMSIRPYRGVPESKQLPATKENYKGKNMSGGRKAIFSQPQSYRARTKIEGTISDRYKSSQRVLLPSGIISVTTPWHGWAA